MKKFMKVLLSLALVAAMVVPTAMTSVAAELTVKDGAHANTGCGFLDGNMDVTSSFDAENTSELTASVNGKTAYFNNGYLGQKHCNLGKNGDDVEKGWVQIGIVGADIKPGTNTVTVADKSGNTATFTFESTINALGTSYAKVIGDAEAKTMKAEIVFNDDPGFAIGTTFEGRCHDDHGNTAVFTVTKYDEATKMYTIEASNYVTNQSLLELKVTSEGDYKGYWVSATINAYTVPNASGLSDKDTNAVIAGATKQTLSGMTSTQGDASKLTNGIGDGTGKWEFGTDRLPASVTFKTAAAVDATYLVLYTGNDDASYWNRAPGAFVLYGSNDGTNWTVIKNVLSSGMKGNANYAPTAFALTDTTAYSQYKLEVKSTLGAGYFQMGELELYTGDIAISDGIPADGYSLKTGVAAYNGTEPKAPAPEKPANRYEAEDAVINMGEIRNASGDYAASVSGGKFVGGFDGWTDSIVFTVNAEKKGTYEMVIGYISMDRRSFDITVNGAKTEDYAFEATGRAWEGDTLTYTIAIELEAGENTITFGQNDGKAAPSLDYIELTFLSGPCEHANTKKVNEKEATLEVPGYSGDIYCLDCERVIEEGEKTYKIPENRYEAEQAVINRGEIRDASGEHTDSVSSGKFVGGFDGWTDSVVFTVNVEKKGTYEMVIGYISMDQRSFDITVNGVKTEDYAFEATGRDWWCDTLTYTIEIELEAGENTITFGQNDNKPAPNLDYIELNLVKEYVPETPDTNVPDTTEPETNVPKTGDMLTVMIAVSAIALAAVAVVVSKKRNAVC